MNPDRVSNPVGLGSMLMNNAVKGKKEPVSVFEIYDGEPENIIALKLKTNPNDKTADLYLKRSA